MPIFRGKPDLLDGFRRGDRTALEAVYRAYADKVANLVRFGFKLPASDVTVTGLRLDPGQVADAVQEVFVKAFARSARATFDGARDYGPYLYAIARNVVVDHGRRAGRELPTEWRRLQEASDSAWVADEELGPWADADTVEVTRRYVGALEGDLKRLHQVRYVEGLSQRDAAVQLGMGRQTLRTLEGRLRAGLEEALAQSRRATQLRAR